MVFVFNIFFLGIHFLSQISKKYSILSELSKIDYYTLNY